MYELFNKNAVAIGTGDFGWSSKDYLIGEGSTLFYPCGLWALYKDASEWKATFGENCFFVPMPRDPEADAYYIPLNMNAYMFVKGGKNPEGVAKYLECKRLATLDTELAEIGNEAFVDDYSWTTEMIAMKNTMDAIALENPVLDFKYAVNTDLTDMLDSGEYGVRAASRGTPWSKSLATIKDAVAAIVDEANSGLDG
jgi:hypothetical protein